MVSGVNIPAPWAQPDAWDGLADNKKEDGWVLVARDFGTPTRAVSGNNISTTPYLFLYNKFTSILRAFIKIQAQGNLSYGAITLKFGSAAKTATLTNVKPRAYALDKMNIVQNNSTSLLTNTPANGYWAWGDFPLAYDPTIIKTSDILCPRLTFQLIGTTESELQINGSIEGVGGTQKDVRSYLTGNSNGPVGISSDLPQAPNSGVDLKSINAKAQATSTNWNSWKTFIGDTYSKFPQFDSGGPFAARVNELKYFIGQIRDSWVVTNLPGLGFVAGIAEALFGGGKSTDQQNTAPTFFGFNANLTGKIVTNYLLPSGASIPVPGVKLDPSSPTFATNVPLLYNNNVGVFNLATTPILQYKSYYQNNTNEVAREYWDFRIKNPLDIKINNQTGLIVDSIRAWISMDVTENVSKINPQNDPDLNLIAGWTYESNTRYRLESTLDNKFVFATKPVDATAFKYQTIRGPIGAGSPDMTIKIKAVFHRQDDPNALPIVIYQTFEPDFENAGTGNWGNPPSPFYVNVIKVYENGASEILPVQVGYIGTDNVNISVPATDNNYLFAGWNDGAFSTTRTITNNANLVAFYKLPTKSNSQTAFSNTGQRKFIRTSDGYLHLVYESMNKIWYERSTDGGATWTIQNNGKPLNTDYKRDNLGNLTGTGNYTVAKHPSMDYLGNYVVITWQEQSGAGYVIRLAFMNNGIPTNTVNKIPFATSYGQYTEDVTPVVAIKESNNSAVIAIKRNDSNFQGIECHYLALDPSNGTSSEYGFGTISGTNANSKNITIATDKASTDKFHVSWQQDGSGYSNVNYARFNFIQNPVGPTGPNIMTSAVSETSAPGDPITMVINVLLNNCISSPTYNTYNYSPSIIAATDGSARVSFKGYYEYDPGYGSYTMSLVNPDNFSYIPYLNKYGGDIFSSQLSLGSDTYFMGWTEFYNNAYRTICTDSHTLRDMETVNNAFGKDFQINNGGTKDQQYVMSFNSESSTLPYSFRRSDAIGTIVVNKKSSISNGRGIFLTKDNAQLHFILGNVKANEVNVNFVDINETIKFDNIDKVNSYLITEPFAITDNSSFTFAVSYGSRDSALTKSSLKESQFGSFKVELIDATSGKLLGSYLDVNMNKNNVFRMKESSFKVSGSGAGSQLVRLRLSVDENMNSLYTVSDMLLGKGILLSKSSVEENEINYKGTLAVKDFALEQNYPNPFNPSTAINYALPKAAYVTLKVYDVLGKEVRTLVNEYKAEGRYSVQFNANSLPSGIYIYQLKAGNNILSRKMMLVK